MKRLVLYAHYDDDHTVKPYVIHALQSMCRVSDDIVFISTSSLDPENISRVAPYVSTTLLAENIGLDFNMWKQGFSCVNHHMYDEVILMNSSVYGPLYDISRVFATMDTINCDFWGITENHELEWHLQSYFLVFRRSAHTSPAFDAFWDSVLPFRNKNQVIRSYEIGLSQWLIGHGLTASVLCPRQNVMRYRASIRYRRYKKPYNPTVAYPGELIILGSPFLKLEVIRDNPFKLDLDSIKSLLHDCGYPDNYLLYANRKAISSDAVYSERCPLCGTTGTARHTRLSDRLIPNGPGCWSIRRCPEHRCNIAWLDPAPEEKRVQMIEAAFYRNRESSLPPRYFPPRYNRLLRSLLWITNGAVDLLGIRKRRTSLQQRALPSGGGRLLEIGCGDTSQLPYFRQLGWEVEGVYSDPEAVRACRSRGVRTHEGRIDNLQLPENSFDVVLITHALERETRPGELLAGCSALLRPGGRLVVTASNARSLGYWLFRSKWFHLDPPRHLIIHTPASLQQLLHDAGLVNSGGVTSAVNFEQSAMQSLDIRCFGWTDLNWAPRIGKELIPATMQLLAVVLHFILPWTGEECVAWAQKPSLTSPQ